MDLLSIAVQFVEAAKNIPELREGAQAIEGQEDRTEGSIIYSGTIGLNQLEKPILADNKLVSFKAVNLCH